MFPCFKVTKIKYVVKNLGQCEVEVSIFASNEVDSVYKLNIEINILSIFMFFTGVANRVSRSRSRVTLSVRPNKLVIATPLKLLIRFS